MCYIDKEVRAKRYNHLRNLGVSRSWAQRVRDFSEPHFKLYLQNGYSHEHNKPLSEVTTCHTMPQ